MTSQHCFKSVEPDKHQNPIHKCCEWDPGLGTSHYQPSAFGKTSGIARVAELGRGPAGVKGLHHGGRHIHETQRADGISVGGLRATEDLQKLSNFRWA